MGCVEMMKSIFGASKNPVTQAGIIKTSNLKKLNIVTGGTDVKVTIHDKPFIDIVLDTFENGPELKVSHHEDTAVIEVTSGEGTWLMAFNHPPNRLQVKVPLDIAENWTVKTGSGDVMVPKLRTNIFQCTAGSGDLELYNIKANEVKVNVSSGDMKIFDLIAEDVQASTTSGDLELRKVKANKVASVSNSGGLRLTDIYSEKFMAKVTSGHVIARDIHVSDVQFTCTSGDVVVKNVTADKAFLKTTSGDIHYEFVDDCSIQGTVTSGDVMIVCKNKQPNQMFKVYTGSGDIRINSQKYIQERSRRHLIGIAGEGKHLIQLQSTSGDVELLYR